MLKHSRSDKTPPIVSYMITVHVLQWECQLNAASELVHAITDFSQKAWVYAVLFASWNRDVSALKPAARQVGSIDLYMLFDIVVHLQEQPRDVVLGPYYCSDRK